MAIAFTCGRCDTRSVKAFSRQAFEQGVVLITCPGCQAMHLIADHLGWFGDRGFKIDEYMQSKGHTVKRVSQEQPQAVTEQLTAEDLAGWSKVRPQNKCDVKVRCEFKSTAPDIVKHSSSAEASSINK
eukprot:gene3968-4221_t